MFASYILPGISLGLTATSIPGPLHAYLMQTALGYGWRRGLLVVLSPLITDAPIILLVVFLLGALPDWAIQAIRVAGGLLLLWIAWGAWQAIRAKASFQANTSAAIHSSPRRILSTAVMMNFLSPGPYLFWSTVNGPLLLAALSESLLHALAFLLAFYGTFLLGMALIALLVGRLGQISARLTAVLLSLTIALLLYYGTALIAEAVGLREAQTLVMGTISVLVFIGMVWRALRPAPAASA